MRWTFESWTKDGGKKPLPSWMKPRMTGTLLSVVTSVTGGASDLAGCKSGGQDVEGDRVSKMAASAIVMRHRVMWVGSHGNDGRAWECCVDGQ